MLRADLKIISEWIKADSEVLDLGCGTGALLSHLKKTKEIRGYGLEIDDKKIVGALKSGINIIQRDLDSGLKDFQNKHFDCVIMTQTLQAVHFPDKLLDEMLRVGKEGIITFPNFGFWKIRLSLLFKGLMPVSKTLPKKWYNTPNIHLCTIRDFEQLCESKKITILNRTIVNFDNESTSTINFFPNFFGEIALYKVKKSSES